MSIYILFREEIWGGTWPSQIGELRVPPPETSKKSDPKIDSKIGWFFFDFWREKDLQKWFKIEQKSIKKSISFLESFWDSFFIDF